MAKYVEKINITKLFILFMGGIFALFGIFIAADAVIDNFFTNPYIELNGKEEVYLTLRRDAYIEEGAVLYDKDIEGTGKLELGANNSTIYKGDITSNAIVSNVDNKYEGTYYIKYEYTTSKGLVEKIREITVIDDEGPIVTMVGLQSWGNGNFYNHYEIGDPLYDLNDSSKLLILDDKKFVASDNDIDCVDNIQKYIDVSQIDFTRPGKYKLYYGATDCNGNTSSYSRDFFVSDDGAMALKTFLIIDNTFSDGKTIRKEFITDFIKYDWESNTDYPDFGTSDGHVTFEINTNGDFAYNIIKESIVVGSSPRDSYTLEIYNIKQGFTSGHYDITVTDPYGNKLYEQVYITVVYV